MFWVAGFFLLIGILIAIRTVRASRRLQCYQAGQCRILAKRLLRESSSSSAVNGSQHMTTTTVYRPQFDFLVLTPDGKHSLAQGYETLPLATSFRNREQAILDQFTVGEVYPCWYDPADPTQAVLTPDIHPLHVLLSILLLGGITLLVAALQ